MASRSQNFTQNSGPLGSRPPTLSPSSSPRPFLQFLAHTKRPSDIFAMNYVITFTYLLLSLLASLSPWSDMISSVICWAQTTTRTLFRQSKVIHERRHRCTIWYARHLQRIEVLVAGPLPDNIFVFRFAGHEVRGRGLFVESFGPWICPDKPVTPFALLLHYWRSTLMSKKFFFNKPGGCLFKALSILWRSASWCIPPV